MALTVPSVGKTAPETRSPAITIWLTGLSGAGKSTIARALERRLIDANRPVEVLDGDVVRTHLSQGLGFSRDDRDTNVRRIAWVCEVLNRHGVDAVVAAISPYRQARDEARARLSHFVEVYVACPLDVLVERDPKGLYRRALAAEIPHFTGVSDPYEAPLDPEVVCPTDGSETVEQSADRIWRLLEDRGYVRSGSFRR